jgi:hypothetical protein
MGARYLTDLADVVRAAGLVVHEEPGWQTRARGSGGYDTGRPNHVMVHHTASPASWDGQRDVDYCTYQDDAAPLCNLYLARTGEVWVCAAGATNTNGTGTDPCGMIPPDTMNASALGIEAGNDGIGEPWPAAQQDAYVTLVAALCSHYVIGVDQAHAHVEYAPGRKIDPAGPSRWAPAGGTWPMDPFRADVAAVLAPVPPEPPEPPEPPRRFTKMYQLLVDDAGNYWAHDSIHVRWLPTTWSRDHYVNLLAAAGINGDAMTVSREAIDLGEFGPTVGTVP